MNIVLEGPDNAGKTTLAHALLRESNRGTYFHPGGKPADLHAEMACMTEQYERLASDGPTIVDRVTAISQQVYNADPELDPIRQTQLDVLRALPNVVFIYCRPPNEVLMDVGNYTWRQDETEEHKQKIITRAHEWIDRYDTIMQRVPCLTYNWRDEAHASVLRTKLVQAMRGSSEAAGWFHSVINFGGRR